MKRRTEISQSLNGVPNEYLLKWAKTPIYNKPKKSLDKRLSIQELAYMTRRLALGDRSHTVFEKISLSNSPASRIVAYKILEVLEQYKIVVDVCFKLPVLNSAKIQAILDGSVVPEKNIRKSGNIIDRKIVYYMIYLRQIKNLSATQIERIVNYEHRTKNLLEQYNMWTNPNAVLSRSYATGKRKHTSLRVKWVHPDSISEQYHLNYSVYKKRIRHYTNVMVKKYGHLLKYCKYLNEFGYEVDHILSVRDGFDFEGKQTPWQMLCHPANLQIILRQDNLEKGSFSEMNPKQLYDAISKFNRKHGTVLIPVDTKTLAALDKKYEAIGKNILSASVRLQNKGE